MTLLLVNAAAAWLLTGIIWFVQLVHYPLFAQVGEVEFPAYHSDHSRRTTWVVALPMLVELAVSAWFVVDRPAGVPVWMAWAGLGCAVVAWALTMLVSVPRHSDLARGFDRTAWSRLVATNWLRTAAWSGHAVFSFGMIWAASR